MNPKKEVKKVEKKQPEVKYKIGVVQVAVWENDVKKDKDVISFMTATLSRSYKDKDDEWQSQSVSLNRDDIHKAITVLQKAYEFMTLNADNSEE